MGGKEFLQLLKLHTNMCTKIHTCTFACSMKKKILENFRDSHSRKQELKFDRGSETNQILPRWIPGTLSFFTDSVFELERNDFFWLVFNVRQQLRLNPARNEFVFVERNSSRGYGSTVRMILRGRSSA